MSKSALLYHKRVQHSSEEKVKCTICTSVFNHQISLQRHMKIHDASAEKFKCDKCEKSFMRKDRLTRHKQSVATLGLSWNFSLAENLASLSLQDRLRSGIIISQPASQPASQPSAYLEKWNISSTTGTLELKFE